MIRVIAVGKNKDKALQSLEKEYCKRIGGFDRILVDEVKDEANDHTDRKAEVKRVKDIEGQRVLAKLKDRDFVILLDLHGTMPDSEHFARSLQDWQTRGNPVFVIAGSLGPSEELVRRADFRLKLSDLTFTHLLTRVLLLEQIYRGFSILNNRNYHK